MTIARSRQISLQDTPYYHVVEIWDTHLSVWGVTSPNPTLPPVDDSFRKIWDTHLFDSGVALYLA
jgi:hypothetical protein